MEQIVVFEKLKDAILIKYQNIFPYSKKPLMHFGNKEIGQLLSSIEQDCKQTISEKWVYTHLKPASVNKLPRKDMLDILSNWVGYSGWDEFRVKAEIKQKTQFKKKHVTLVFVAILFVLTVSMSFFILKSYKNEYHICFYDQYTQEAIAQNRITVFLHAKNVKKIPIKDNCIIINNENDSIKIKVESPYYKDKSFTIKHEQEQLELSLQPDDYTLMLYNYMNSNIKDWKKRRQQLENIIHDDAEIIEVMQNNIGVEFLNKTEFINKITTPIKSVDNMEIIDIKYTEDKKIESLRFFHKQTK